MPTCRECKHYFSFEGNPEKGDCVERVVDPRQAYHKAKPVDGDRDASECDSFQKK